MLSSYSNHDPNLLTVKLMVLDAVFPALSDAVTVMVYSPSFSFICSKLGFDTVSPALVKDMLFEAR